MPARTVSRPISVSVAAVCGARMSRRRDLVIGVSGWWRIEECSSSVPFTYRLPSRTVRPFAGKDGTTMVRSAPAIETTASSTGPMLPSSVESNVEQYFT